MIWRCHLPGRILADDRGATIVEFAIVALPLFVLVLGGFDLGYQSYVRTMMQGALIDAARKAAVEDPVLAGSGSTVEERVENSIRDSVGIVAPNADISVSQRSYFDFAAIGNPEKLMTDHNGNGEFDEDDGDCWEDVNENGVFDTDAGAEGRGGANDVVFYTATIRMPRLIPWDSLIGDSPGDLEMVVETAVRTQPYGPRQAPPVLCGATS